MMHREHDKETAETLVFQFARPDFIMPKFCSQSLGAYVLHTPIHT